MSEIIFLQNPYEIRKKLKTLQGNGVLNIAVAFIGADWASILAEHTGKLRIICWFSSTNTNPYAVEQLIKRSNTQVMQRNSMHSKVYFKDKIGAIVSSANLSKSALQDEPDINGQGEAGTFIKNINVINEISQWFDNMWNDKKGGTKKITKLDMELAKDAWNRARKFRQNNHSVNKKHSNYLPEKFSNQLLYYAEKVRNLDLYDDLGKYHRVVSGINPQHLTMKELKDIIACLVEWSGRSFAFNNFRNQPLQDVRVGLRLLFDNSMDLQSRLQLIEDNKYLNGLRMRSLSLLLYWRSPELYPPYNLRTKKMLSKFNIATRGISDSSPVCYSKWITFSYRLYQQLELPSAGHIDRIVTRYFEEHER